MKTSSGESIITVSALKKEFQIKKATGGLRSRFKNLLSSKTETFLAVNSISLNIAEGEAVALIGPNGAGKSTTIKMLTGILYPTSGEATVCGMNPWKQRVQLAHQIGSVFGQKSQLWMHLPPNDTFELMARIYELDLPKFRRRKDMLIELFEMKEFIDVPTRKLSLGQRMRCEIASSLLHSPKVIFLDEPTIGLDPVAKASIRDLIKRVNQEEKVTVLLTSHDSGDIEKLCKRVIIINKGAVVFDDSTGKLKREFLQKKEINLKLNSTWPQALRVDQMGFPGVDVIKSSDYGLKISVDTSQSSVGALVQKLLAQDGIEDISIHEAPLEEIIAQIYRSHRVGAV